MPTVEERLSTIEEGQTLLKGYFDTASRAIYQLSGEVRQLREYTVNGFNVVHHEIAQLSKRMDALEQQMDKLEQRMDALEQRMGDIEKFLVEKLPGIVTEAVRAAR